MSTDIHIDTVHGIDTAPGTRLDPVKTFVQAKLLIGSAPLSTLCMLNVPEYAPIIFPGASHAFTQGECLITGDARWWAQGATVTLLDGWTALANGIYSHPLPANVFLAVLLDTLDADGYQYCFQPRDTNTGQPTTPAAGECGWKAGIFYLHMVGDADPNGRQILIGQQSYTLFGKGTAILNVEKGNFRFGNGTLVNVNEHADLNLLDCTFGYAGVTCVGGSQSAVSTSNISADHCRVWRAVTNDGYSIGGGANPGDTSLTLTECESDRVFEEGMTAHGKSKLIARGGRYQRSGESGMRSVDYTEVDLQGVLFDHNWRNGSLPGREPLSGGVSIANFSQASVEYCIIRDHPGAGLWKSYQVGYSPVFTSLEGTLSEGLNGMQDQL